VYTSRLLLTLSHHLMVTEQTSSDVATSGSSSSLATIRRLTRRLRLEPFGNISSQRPADLPFACLRICAHHPRPHEVGYSSKEGAANTVDQDLYALASTINVATRVQPGHDNGESIKFAASRMATYNVKLQKLRCTSYPPRTSLATNLSAL